MKIACFLFIFIFISISIKKIKSDCPPTKESIEYLINDGNIPGIAIIVTNSKEILYQQAIGYHSPKQIQLINLSSSIFPLGSISKTFIVLSIMQMVELNQLNLDKDINEYLLPLMKIIHPYYSNITITIRHLLSHTSGIGPNLIEELKHYSSDDNFIQTNLGYVLNEYLNHNSSWLPISPGNITFYSNIGATLAAFIVEHVSGLSFEKYVQENIIKPLNINGSYRINDFKENLIDHFIYNISWLETYQQMVPQLNISKIENISNWLYIPLFGSSIYPSGFLRMSSYSLCLYIQSFLNNFSNLLYNSSSIDEMLKIFPQESYMNKSDLKFGLIWNWKIQNNRRLIGHDGSLPGIANSIRINEERNLAIIVLTNGDITRDDKQAKYVQQIIDQLIDQLFDCFDPSFNKCSVQNYTTSIRLIFFFLFVYFVK